MVTASRDASLNGSRSVSASRKVVFRPRRNDFSRARCSMGWQKSVPRTLPAEALLKASARSPVPQQRSATTEDGKESTGMSDLTVARRHAISTPADKKWFSRSYRGATAANMLRTADAVACSSTPLPTVVPLTAIDFTLIPGLRLLHAAERFRRSFDRHIAHNPD